MNWHENQLLKNCDLAVFAFVIKLDQTFRLFVTLFDSYLVEENTDTLLRQQLFVNNCYLLRSVPHLTLQRSLQHFIRGRGTSNV